MALASRRTVRSCVLLGLVLATAGVANPCRGAAKLKPVERPRLPPITIVEPLVVATFPEAAEALSVARTVDDAEQALKQLASSDDPFGLVMTKSLCAGMDQMAQLDDPEQTGDNWRSFLIDQGNAQLKPASRPSLTSYVDRLMTIWDLGQVNVRAAYTYAKACLRLG
jgi:hypothetical protein